MLLFLSLLPSHKQQSEDGVKGQANRPPITHSPSELSHGVYPMLCCVHDKNE